MAELAQILAHNVLNGATFQTTNELAGHELDRMADGYRHTWWQAPSTAIQLIEFRCANLIFNYGFENNSLFTYIPNIAYEDQYKYKVKMLKKTLYYIQELMKFLFRFSAKSFSDIIHYRNSCRLNLICK